MFDIDKWAREHGLFVWDFNRPVRRRDVIVRSRSIQHIFCDWLRHGRQVASIGFYEQLSQALCIPIDRMGVSDEEFVQMICDNAANGLVKLEPYTRRFLRRRFGVKI